MLNIGGGELLIIFLVALIVLGPGKLPEAARQAGQVMREFRRISSGFQRELKQAMDDPVAAATREPSSTKTLAATSTPADVTDEAEVPPMDTPEADASWSGDDPETRQARAESIAKSTPATPINPDADPFTSKVSDPFSAAAHDPSSNDDPPPDTTGDDGMSSDR